MLWSAHRTFLLLVVAALATLGLATPTTTAGAAPSEAPAEAVAAKKRAPKNLIKNPSAEQTLPSRFTGGQRGLKLWTVRAGKEIAANRYGDGGYPSYRDPGPGKKGGKFMFVGGDSKSSSA